MKKWILITLLIQALFFAGWGLSESMKLSQGLAENGEFLLDTRTVDPRDWLSGQYMTVNPLVADASAWLPYDSDPAQDAAVLLQQKGTLTLEGKTYPFYTSIQALRPAPQPLPSPAANQLWVRATGGQPSRLSFGIEKYFFSEDRKGEMNDLRSGRFYARVTAAPDGSLKLLGLVKKQGQD